jgi:predicted fused transcriptional regulator/phosphomethylpyrimidine kinase
MTIAYTQEMSLHTSDEGIWIAVFEPTVEPTSMTTAQTGSATVGYTIESVIRDIVVVEAN